MAAVMPERLHFILMESISDMDRRADLHRWQKVNKATTQEALVPKISVIIPVLNEAAAIVRTLSCLEGIVNVEVIVVDGGSFDKTAALARSCGAKVVQSMPGKAVQMNTGARAATGDLLVFLHADTLLPKNFSHLIVSALAQNSVAAGAFRLSINSTRAGIRIIERMANLRSRLLQLPYGDQALFMRKVLFEEVGGFPDVPIMEDFILMRRLKHKGKIVLLPESAMTSPRRWLHFGIFKTWLINQMIIIAYYLGFSLERLNRWYRREANKKGR